MTRQLFISLIVLFTSTVVWGQTDLNKTRYNKTFFDIPNDSTIELGNCPSVGQMDIQFQKVNYNSKNKTLHIKGKVVESQTKEPLTFVTVTHCFLDFDKIKIKAIKSYSLNKDNSFDLKLQIDKGQCVVFRLLGYHPIAFQLDKLRQ